MFKLSRSSAASKNKPLKPAAFSFGLEGLEDRRMLSATVHAVKHVVHAHHNAVSTVSSQATTTSSGTCDGNGGGDGGSTTTYTALQTSDAAAATELQTLATTHSITIAGTQTVDVRTVNSTTTYYSVELTPSTGTDIRLITDQAGNPVTPPTSSTTTFGDTTIPAAATAEITSLATVLGATAPVSTDSVAVRTANGLTTYSVSLAPSSTTTTTDSDGDTDTHNIRISVDAAGNPAGHMKIPFSALPTAVSGGLTTLAGSTTIPTTQNVFVRTGGGVTTYTVHLASSGQSLSFTVDTTGAAATPASGGDGFGGFGRSGFGGGFGREFGGGFGGFHHHGD